MRVTHVLVSRVELLTLFTRKRSRAYRGKITGSSLTHAATRLAADTHNVDTVESRVVVVVVVVRQQQQQQQLQLELGRHCQY